MKKLTKVSSAGKSEKIVGKDEKFDSSKYWIENGIDLEKRRIMLDEEVDEYSMGWLFRAVYKMVDMDSSAPIDFVINSYGGSVYDGLMLYDLIRSLDYLTVRTYATGKIMSMGLLLYLAGDERNASQRSTFMAHSLSSGMWGKMRELEVEVNECKRLNKELIGILADRTEKTAAWWTKEIKHEDRFYNKEKAIELGIVDEDDAVYE